MRTPRLWLTMGVVGALVGGYFIGRARAGIPTTTPLFYSGYLEDATGPVTDTKAIVVTLFDAVTGGAAVCNPAPSGTMPAKTQVVAGRFRIALDATCTAALQSKSEVWIEVNVEGQPLPRSKVGAVPYALNAGNVDWTGVTGVNATTEWPGTIPYSRVTNPRPVYTNTATGKSYSLNAGYCGATSAATGAIADGTLTGYPAAKSLCEKKCGSPTAHMCSAEEMVRFYATGGTVPQAGWYSTAIRSWDGSANVIECEGWTTTSTTSTGAFWASGISPSLANSSFCNAQHPVLCCD